MAGNSYSGQTVFVATLVGSVSILLVWSIVESYMTQSQIAAYDRRAQDRYQQADEEAYHRQRNMETWITTTRIALEKQGFSTPEFEVYDESSELQQATGVLDESGEHGEDGPGSD